MTNEELERAVERLKTRELGLDELTPQDKGRAIKGMDFDCGIFCEERAS